MGGFAFTSQINKGRCQSASQEGLLNPFKLLGLSNKNKKLCGSRGGERNRFQKKNSGILLQILILNTLMACQGHFSTYRNLPLYNSSYVTEQTC